ncbi:ribose transport system substrate-binding protein [Actinoalloteichus hoggarensis]|uniref:D-ribose-binding periplasmic protein n=1 Tax=Actinoalloteichus hoggarensis TaxID=1470176 RepID=A0A221W6P8_9PSEU|nr:substrate-binding domain-containing protein [Actinoalloteichus hoggarensis]ASO21316.1 D-ribose-binding periplasmic protein precursor [Actinoalloteichus hoggarensis]MBB5921249.1 ribose transport system substrate-binding protein [Actinoalloteichus hoggarensis]
MRVRTRSTLTIMSAAALLVLGACTSEVPADTDAGTETTGADAAADSEFFVQSDYEAQMALREAAPEGPEDRPWEQMIDPEMVDTSEYQQEGPYNLCFSNAGLFNSWRAVGWRTMQAEVDLHPEIENFTALDGQGQDDKQISDIGSLAGQDCDALIVSPNTTATLTPAVEAACGEVPVIVFDRGVETDCPVTFISPIGGYAYGAAGAEFLRDEVEPGGSVLALRIAPGVDVLEHRWAAAEQVFEDSDLEIVGVQFTEDDPATAKNIVSDYIQRTGGLDGVWMDAGATSVAVTEAFEDAGMEIPPIVGEDQQDFLQAWRDKDLTAIAPGYPTFQWRTPVIAALRILNGEEVPREWRLPQPVVTEDNLDSYLQEGMPPQHYALCGCEDLPGFPEEWGG